MQKPAVPSALQRPSQSKTWTLASPFMDQRLEKTRRKKLVSDVGKFKCVFRWKSSRSGVQHKLPLNLLATSLLLKRRSRDSVWAERRMQSFQQNQRHYKRWGTRQQSASRDDTVWHSKLLSTGWSNSTSTDDRKLFTVGTGSARSGRDDNTRWICEMRRVETQNVFACVTPHTDTNLSL